MALTNTDEALGTAVRYHEAGRLPEAEAIYRQILSQAPHHPETLRMLALLGYQVGRPADALPLIERAITGRPSEAIYHAERGVILASLGRFDDALRALCHSLALRPSDVNAVRHLVDVVVRKHSGHELARRFLLAASGGPDRAGAFQDLGQALQEKGDLDAAVDAYLAAVALDPGDAQAHLALGNALRSRGRSSEAVEAYRRALAVRPRLPEALNNLGGTLLGKGRIDEAIQAFRDAISQKSDYAAAYNNLGSALKESGRIDESLEALRRASDLRADPLLAGNLLYVLHFHPESTPQSLHAEHVKWNERFAKQLSPAQPAIPRGSSRGRLRIGYISPNFREHPVGRFMLPLLTKHDHSKFEIHVYTDVTVPDRLTVRLKSLVDVWKPTAGLSDARLADLIRNDGIDILVDLNMHMSGSRLLAFARKPAPVQLTYLAYCSTTGLDAMDFRLSDPYLDPPGCDESVYSERTIRLPRTYWCYPPPEDAPDVVPPPAMSAGHVTFGCFNNFSKVTRQALETWAQILSRVPNSNLLIHSNEGSHRQAALDVFVRHGIDSGRVRFTGFCRLEEYLARYNLTDISLDPFPYGGGTTTCDSLFMGVPVVTLAGRTAVSRGGASILTNVGVTDLIASSLDQYVSTAVQLANDLGRLAELRGLLRARLQASALSDARHFTADVEAIYSQIALCRNQRGAEP